MFKMAKELNLEMLYYQDDRKNLVTRRTSGYCLGSVTALIFMLSFSYSVCWIIARRKVV
jgi:hypothetical protein